MPTGLQACANSKSQSANKRCAMTILKARLSKKDDAIRHKERKEDRISQVGYITRGSKVRTYNFIEDRVKDERIKKKFSTKEIMKGRLDLIYGNMN